LSRSTVTRQAAAAIAGMLRDGRYRVGDRLPSEREIAAELDVGISAVREAVRGLIALDLVEIRPGRGTYVRSLREDLLRRSDGFGAAPDEAARGELLEVRRIIEPAAAALAARRANEDDASRLRHDVDRLAEVIGHGFRPPEDLGFHLDVVRATHNGSLSRMAGAIISFYDRDGTLPTQRDADDHRDIMEAIRDHQPDRARRAMLEHLLDVASGD